MKIVFKVLDFVSGLVMSIIGGVFLAASLIGMLLSNHTGMHMGGNNYFIVDPAWATIVICGSPIVFNAIYYLFKERMITTALLITIAIIASIAIGEYFAAGEVAFIMAIGGILEAATTRKARKGLSNLISLIPELGRRIRPDSSDDEMVPLDQINIGDILRILPGETVPVDGVIIAGNSSIDQSIMTGEYLPVDKAPGDEVYCGTINRFGSIDVRTTKQSGDTSIRKLINLVKEAENNTAPIQRVADKWASRLVPIALGIAIIVFLITWDIIRAVTILVVFCPCALTLATPTAIMAAIGQATKHGVVIKSGNALERMGKVNLIAFDKTGTLTTGLLTVSNIKSFDNEITDDELLRIIASAESRSEHPLGKAVVSEAGARQMQLYPVSDFVMTPGKGISATVNGTVVTLGSASYINEIGLDPGSEAQDLIDTLSNEGKALIIAADPDAGRCLGLIALSDTIRPDSKALIDDLKKTKSDSVLLTGDNRRAAGYFAGQIGISQVYSELLPAQKVEMISKLRASGNVVCMIGDGVNDAPSLKTADVGVAMGGMGSDIAVDAADIALMGDDISAIPYLRRLARAAVKLIKLNISISLTINFIAITLSILALLNPVTGALVHNVGSVLVVLNAAMLYDRKFD